MINIFRLDRTRKHVVIMKGRLGGYPNLEMGEEYTLKYCDDCGYPPNQSLQDRFRWHITGLRVPTTMIRVTDSLASLLEHRETLDKWW